MSVKGKAICGHTIKEADEGKFDKALVAHEAECCKCKKKKRKLLATPDSAR